MTTERTSAPENEQAVEPVARPRLRFPAGQGLDIERAIELSDQKSSITIDAIATRYSAWKSANPTDESPRLWALGSLLGVVLAVTLAPSEHIGLVVSASALTLSALASALLSATAPFVALTRDRVGVWRRGVFFWTRKMRDWNPRGLRERHEHSLTAFDGCEPMGADRVPVACLAAALDAPTLAMVMDWRRKDAAFVQSQTAPELRAALLGLFLASLYWLSASASGSFRSALNAVLLAGVFSCVSRSLAGLRSSWGPLRETTQRWRRGMAREWAHVAIAAGVPVRVALEAAKFPEAGRRLEWEFATADEIHHTFDAEGRRKSGMPRSP